MIIIPFPSSATLSSASRVKPFSRNLTSVGGYNNIHIKEEDRWKAAFKTPFGLYEPTVMYFGLTNSPATFCRAMQKMLRHWLNKYPDETGNYVNDMVVATKGDRQRHQQIVGELLQIFQENSYFL